MKQFTKLCYILFTACLIAGASACSDETTIVTPCSSNPTVLFQIDSLVINTSNTGNVNVSAYREYASPLPDSNVRITFDAFINGACTGDLKYLSVETFANNQVNFVYTQYNTGIAGSHSFTQLDAFDKIIFYIKIFDNTMPGAFIKLKNIKIVKL